MEAILFYLFSALAVASSLLVIFLPRPVRALLSLIVTMVSLTVLYILLGAHFVAIAQIIVYAGAVLVLFLFVIMLQGIGASDLPLGKRFHPFFTLCTFLATAGLAFFLSRIFSGAAFSPWNIPQGTVEAVGRVLFTQFILPFELTAILLLLSVFAAVSLARREDAS